MKTFVYIHEIPMAQIKFDENFLQGNQIYISSSISYRVYEIWAHLTPFLLHWNGVCCSLVGISMWISFSTCILSFCNTYKSGHLSISILLTRKWLTNLHSLLRWIRLLLYKRELSKTESFSYPTLKFKSNSKNARFIVEKTYVIFWLAKNIKLAYHFTCVLQCHFSYYHNDWISILIEREKLKFSMKVSPIKKKIS